MATTKKKPAAKPKPKGKEKPEAKGTKQPKPKDYGSPDVLARYDASSHELLTNAREAVEGSRRSYLSLKQQAADAKKTMEAAIIDLEKVQSDRARYRGKQPPAKQLTFDDAPTTNEEAVTRPKLGTSPKEPTGTTWYPNDLVMSYPLAQWVNYGLTAKDVECLRVGAAKRGDNMPITVYGDISKFMQPKPEAPDFTRGYTDIKGIGAEGATRISDSEERFLKAWNDGLAELFAREKGFTPPTKAGEEQPESAGV